MIRRIRQWWRNRHRAIFKYFDGHRWRQIDPLQAATHLAMHPTYRPEHLAKAIEGDPEAMVIVADAACDVFGVRELGKDGRDEGMTWAELIGLVDLFDQYCWQLQKKTGNLPTSQPSTAPETWQDSSEKTTPDIAPCTSPATDPLSEGPKLSDLEPLRP